MSNPLPISPQSNNIVTLGNQNIGPFYWVGPSKNGVNYFAGQTFKVSASGELKNIKLYCSFVVGFPRLKISIYTFEQHNHIWRNKIREISKKLNNTEENYWIEFDMQNIEVDKGEDLGFKLKCIEGGTIAIAECPWNKPNPYADGEQWIGSSINKIGKFQKDFAFAFAAEIDVSPKSKFI